MMEEADRSPSRSPAGNWRFVVALLGARMHYAVPRILNEVGCLERLFTDSCAVKGLSQYLALLPRCLQPAGIRRLLARVPTGIPASRITCLEWLGWQYALKRTRVAQSSEMTAVFLWANRAFGNLVCRNNWGEGNAVFTFNTAGLEILRLARSRRYWAVMEQTIAPRIVEERLVAEERQAFPGWENEAQDRLLEACQKREEEEWQLADTIVCGSDFVKDRIGACGGPVDRCVTVPYGVDSPPASGPRQCHGGKLRVLMCGTVCLRKGVPYLVEAAKALKGRAEFRIVGPSAVAAEVSPEIERHVALSGAVPRNQMAEHYQWADVFVLPSICEGSATVVYEAIGHGLPVVTTPNAGSVVRDGVEGFVVPIRDAAAIVQSLDRLLSDPQLRLEMSHRAYQRSLEFTVKRYQERLLQILTPQVSH
ncbi:MAG: glycosyltransferase family 4 protein [Thermoguttaceae bacterium]|jgi:glycosyltransferase involved in cell wall biosynthesis